MNDINLIRYHDRSASEINMLMAGEMTDQLFSRVVLGIQEQRTGPSRLVLLLTMAASMVCALYASYVIYNVYINRVPDFVSTLDKEAIMAKYRAYKLQLATGGDPYLIDGYTKIAVVEQTEEEDSQPVVVVSEYQVPIDRDANPELFTKPVEITKEPEKRKRDKRALITPVLTGNYSIQFLDISEADANKVRVLAESNDFKLKRLGSTKKYTRRWNVYRESKNSKTIVGGKNVKFVRSFKSRGAAVKYLQQKNIRGVVASKTNYYNQYDMQVCCLGEEAAEKLARGSGINMRKIKILKK
jgi:hypothetical protein